jgi:hypothetical protein
LNRLVSTNILRLLFGRKDATQACTQVLQGFGLADVKQGGIVFSPIGATFVG